MQRKLSRWRQVLLWLCGLLFVWAWLPLWVDGSFGMGVMIPVAVSVIGAACAVFAPPFDKAKGWGKGMWIAGVAMACAVAVMAGVISALMLHAAVTPPREQ